MVLVVGVGNVQHLGVFRVVLEHQIDSGYVEPLLPVGVELLVTHTVCIKAASHMDIRE